jgi:dTDP-4-amino-4,6-dideoxygalactose transaminase
MSERLAIDGGPEAVDDRDSDICDWPIITEEDEEAALDVLRRGAMSGTEITKEFEAEFAEWHDREYALGFNNGTASLLGAMYGVGVGAGDEVVGPSMTYWATMLPCIELGATPVFADIEPDTLCVDPDSVAERVSDDTAAIVVTHYSGHPTDMDPIVEIAREHDASVIEDVSHAHGARYEGQLVGNIGDVGAMSMMSGKSFPIGEGGMLVTDDREIYERAVAYGHYTRHDELTEPELTQYADLPFGGHKHRMHQISAAVGRVQLKSYDERMAEIQRALNYFWDLLEDVPGIRPHRVEDEDSTMGGWYNPKGLYVADELGGLSLDRFAEAVEAEGSSCSPGCNFPLHTHPLMNEADVYGEGKPTRLRNASRDVREEPGSLPVAEGIEERVYNIPWFKHYRPEEIEAHARAYRKVAENHEELLDVANPADD